MISPQSHFFPPSASPETPGEHAQNWQALAERWARIPVFEPQLITSDSETDTIEFTWGKDESWTNVLFDLRSLATPGAEITTDGLYVTPVVGWIAIDSAPIPAGIKTSEIVLDTGTFDGLTQILVWECLPTRSVG